MNNESTIFIVDDNEQVRHALTSLLESVGLVVESFDSAISYLNQFDSAKKGCLILDVRMPGMSGMELQSRLSQEFIHPPIVMITGHGDVPMAVRAVQAGAIDFIQKPFNDQEILDSVHQALEQDDLHRGEASRIEQIQIRLNKLTPREKEVLDEVVKGKRNKVIAQDLGVQQSTVEAHRSKVMDKMEAKNLSDLMRMMLSIEIGNGKP